jgi:CheY-like chemotaxis protein
LPGTGIKGLGVGLALVRQLVELHGGTVAAQSGGQQRGSEFTVRLPILAQHSPAQEQPSPSPVPAGASAQPRNLLIVDDHRDSADALSALLQDLGHQVTTSYDGRSALKEANTHRPEVVIMDIGLPDMNGHEVAAQIRELLPGSMLIALSGWRPEDTEPSDHAGFDHYLVKPVEIAHLSKLLAKI